MERKNFLKAMATLPFAGGLAMKLNALNEIAASYESTERMPVLFVGHGSPMNAIEDNVFSREMRSIGKKLPRPSAILMVSAHWETNGTFVTGQQSPVTIHDFGGFPQALFDVQYPAKGSKWLGEELISAVAPASVAFDDNWGYDHGCWSVTKNMFPAADIPLIQMSLDYTKGPEYHYNLGKQLAALRRKGVLIIGSGNMVHNFQYAQVKGGDFNAPFGHDWALEANETFKQLISENEFKSLINYDKYSRALKLSAPTPEHYLPLLYSVALREKDDAVSFFNDQAVAGSFTMTSVLINKG
jgi:4,5-DOPA dioxygenase extradiol